MKRGLAIAVVAAFVVAAPAAAAAPRIVIGAAEDFVKEADPIQAKANMDLAALVGFGAIRVTAIWSPGATAPSASELAVLQNAATAAQLNGIEPYVAVYHRGARTTPLTATARGQFAGFAASIARAIPSFRHFIIGNEPNLNRFWMPQFNLDGSNAAAPAYGALLARTYDALKAVSPRIRVIGGAVSPRGSDKPSASRHTHSPGKFITDLGRWYRKSGRTRPLMDEFAFHPYPGNPSLPPRPGNPRSKTIGLADYGRLVVLLGRAFDGTRQLGSRLPILYAELGVESVVPAPKRVFYTGREPATTKPVDEATQVAFYGRALQLAACQPTVRGLLVFHVADEHALEGWQSGVYYADRSPKSNLDAMRAAVQAVRRSPRRCGRVNVPFRAHVALPRRPRVGREPLALYLRCQVNCTYVARLESVPLLATAAVARGRATAARPKRVELPGGRLAPGAYRFSVRVSARIPRSAPLLRVSRVFRLGRAREAAEPRPLRLPP